MGVRGFVLKRKLIDAIRNNPSEVDNALAEIQSFGLTSTILGQPVDECLNTPLHIAVEAGDVASVTALLQHGADPTQRNLRGDTPSQFFLWPKIHLAACTVRQS